MVNPILVDSIKFARLGVRDRVSAVMNIFFGIVFTGLAFFYESQENLHFRCKSDDHKNIEHLQKECFLQYDKVYNSPSLVYFIVFSFLAQTVVCMVYSSCVVNSRVLYVIEQLKSDKDNNLELRKIKTRRIFFCCFAQLTVRFGLSQFFALLELIWYHDGGFPSHFSCHSKDDCVNAFGPKKKQLSEYIFAAHTFFALFLYFEAAYLFYKRMENNEYQFDSVFCQKYLHISEESLGSNQWANRRRNTLRGDWLQLNLIVPNVFVSTCQIDYLVQCADCKTYVWDRPEPKNWSIFLQLSRLHGHGVFIGIAILMHDQHFFYTKL